MLPRAPFIYPYCFQNSDTGMNILDLRGVLMHVILARLERVNSSDLNLTHQN
jgi:hypothetical protein